MEYCHGDSTTAWGRQRIADGHPEPYNVTHFELGNEQYNAAFASQVTAMEARAKKLGLPPKTLHYLWPQGPGDSPGRANFAPTAADAAAINALGLGTNIMSDIHGGRYQPRALKRLFCVACFGTQIRAQPPAEAPAAVTLGLFWLGPAIGGVAKAEQVFAEKATSTWGAMNLET